MTNEIKIDGSFNISVQGVGENAEVGITQNIVNSPDYNKLVRQLEKDEMLLAALPEDDLAERIRISQEIEKTKSEIKQFEEIAAKSYASIQAIGNKIDEETLNQLKELVSEGKFTEAREFLESDAKKNPHDITKLIQNKENSEKALKIFSEKQFQLALLTQLNYDNPNRYEDTCKYFELSLKSYETEETHFYFGAFLQFQNKLREAETQYQIILEKFGNQLEAIHLSQIFNNLAVIHDLHNEYELALTEYNEALKIMRGFAETEPQIYLPQVSNILNNLGILSWSHNYLDEALSYLKEALIINRNLADANPIYFKDVATTLSSLGNVHRSQTLYFEASNEYTEALEIFRNLEDKYPSEYLHQIATNLNNFAVLHRNNNEKVLALKEIKEALEIRKQLSNKNPLAYLPSVATTLANVGNVYSDLNDYEKALIVYEESLEILRKLAEENPLAFLPSLGMTLNNLANLQCDQNKFDEALKNYKEALHIRKYLAKKNNLAFLPDLATTLMNISLYYQESVPNRELSIQYALEVLILLLDIIEKLPLTSKHYKNTLAILNVWGLNNEEIELMIAEKMKNMTENKI